MRTLWQVFKHKPVARSDDQLLLGFVRDKSEEAFADLVKRHGGMVLSVCRRILGHSQDAEDAFQAAFLVLAQKAHCLHGDSPLGPWLYGVARRVAMKARSRRTTQLPLSETDQPEAAEEATSMATSMEWSELRPIIDEEIAHLPGHYRNALILCQLDGMSRLDAARQLGVPEGTLSSRLMRAKEMLRIRLQRRGIALTSLTLLDAVLAMSPVSAQLAQSTVGLAMKVALDTGLSVGVSSSILTLAQGASQAMIWTKMQMTALAVVLVAGLSAGTTYVAGGWGQEKQAGKNTTASAAIKPKEAAPKETTARNPKPSNKPLDGAAASVELGKVNDQLSNLVGEDMRFDDCLQFLEKQTGLACVIDAAAFREQFAGFNQKDLRQQNISVPRMTNQTTGAIIHAILDGLTYQEQPLPATFMVRRGTLVIVPRDYLPQAASKIQVALDTANQELSLAEALERLSQDTGISIILDSRVKEQASDCRISNNFRNIKLINAVRLLANMANLTVINIDGALYVSTAENCKKMEDEMARDGL